MLSALLAVQLVLFVIQVTIAVIGYRRESTGLMIASSLLCIPSLFIAFVVVPSL